MLHVKVCKEFLPKLALHRVPLAQRSPSPLCLEICVVCAFLASCNDPEELVVLEPADPGLLFSVLAEALYSTGCSYDRCTDMEGLGCHLHVSHTALQKDLARRRGGRRPPRLAARDCSVVGPTYPFKSRPLQDDSTWCSRYSATCVIRCTVSCSELDRAVECAYNQQC